MKQIITVLAILISGIASAQSNPPSQIWETSYCGPEGNKRLVYEGQDYTILDDIVSSHENSSWIVCLDGGNGSLNREWRSYFINYLGATRIEDRTNQNHYSISFPNGVIIERRTSGRYNVRVTLRGLQSRYNASQTNNARDAWNYALRN